MKSRSAFLNSKIVTPLAIFAFALVFRLIGIGWGLPNADRWYPYHPDERDVAAAVYQLDFLAGQFNPHFFNYPSLFIYLTYIVHGATSLLGFTLSPQHEWSVLREIILAGRLVSVVLGAATASLVYLIALEWQKGKPKPVDPAIWLLAFLPAHLIHSRFATVDISATFFITACLLFATRALRDTEPPKWVSRQLLLSALLAGLATATKYNAIIVFVAPLVSAWILTRKAQQGLPQFLRTSLPLVPACLAAFIIGCPGAVFAFPEFWGDGKNSGFAFELLVHPRLGSGDIFKNTGNGWWYHLSLNLPYAVSTPILLLAAVGMGMILFQLVQAKKNEYAPVIIFAVLYFVSLGLSEVRFLRYILPLLPVLCLYLTGAETLLRERKTWEPAAKAFRAGTWVTYILLLLATSSATSRSQGPAGTDPRDQAAAWMKTQSAAGGAPLTIGLLDNPWFYTPPFVKQDARPGTPPEAVAALLASQPGYDLKVIGLDPQKLLEVKPQYVVMTDFEWRDKLRLQDPQFLEFFKTLKENYDLKECFGRHAGRTLAGQPGADELVTTEPHDFIYTNPQVRIYARRN